MVRKRATAHTDVAVPYGLVAVEINVKSLLFILDGRNGVAGTLACAGAAMQADVARVKNGIGLKLAVGKDQTKTNARSEFLGKKDLGKADLAESAACRDNANAANNVGRNKLFSLL